MTLPSFFSYWGKAKPDDVHEEGGAFHLLPYHSLDVAAVGEVLLAKHPRLRDGLAAALGLPSAVFERWMLYFLALHDIGKFAESFQGMRADVFGRLHGRSPTKHYRTRHDSLGNALWNQRVRTAFMDHNPLELEEAALTDCRAAFDRWMEAMTGHHGQPPEKRRLALDEDFSSADIEAATGFLTSVGFLVHDLPRISVDPDGFDWAMPACSWWLAGAGVLCDWLGSNRAYFPYEDRPDIGLEAYWERARAQAERAFASSGLEPARIAAARTLSKLFDYIEVPSDLQRQASELALAQEPQLFILEDRTGSGKTEAALMLAHRLMHAGQADGLYFALPTMATANAMFQRLQRVHPLLFADAPQASLILAHSKRRLIDAFSESILMPGTPPAEADFERTGELSASSRCAAWLADNTKKALLASTGVGTIDQALMAVLATKHQSLRLLGLFRKVLVVDEVHANDAYMHRLLCILLRFHAAAGGSIILLSATLPRAMRSDLFRAFARGRNNEDEPPSPACDDYPLLSHCTAHDLAELPAAGGADRRVRVTLTSDLEAVEAAIAAAAEGGQCVCWIRNTVSDAVEAHARLEGKLPGRVALFHARFMLGDRLDIENAVVSRFGKDGPPDERRGRVLVATQVVEQSLDLDFDFMVTDLAPIDLLIQRAGRLHRHTRDAQGRRMTEGAERRPEPRMLMLGPSPDEVVDAKWLARALPGTSVVYPHHGQVWRTARLLVDLGEIVIPRDARALIESVFLDEAADIPEPLGQASQRSAGEAQAERSVADFNGLSFEAGYCATSRQWRSESAAPTRLGEPTAQVCLLRWRDVRLDPLYDAEADHPWAMSQLSVRQSLVRGEATPCSEQAQRALADLRARHKFMKDWLVLVPMTEAADGCWYGDARDNQERLVRLVYCRTTGLRVERAE